ncbi:hypothetical protein QP794_11540 [Paenibacillus sp. UMB7766-LJ446]|nr:hypothetical protein [Paenibacillus sp. UMB7766-LJ446]
MKHHNVTGSGAGGVICLFIVHPKRVMKKEMFFETVINNVTMEAAAINADNERNEYR